MVKKVAETALYCRFGAIGKVLLTLSLYFPINSTPVVWSRSR